LSHGRLMEFPNADRAFYPDEVAGTSREQAG